MSGSFVYLVGMESRPRIVISYGRAYRRTVHLIKSVDTFVFSFRADMRRRESRYKVSR